MKVLVIGYQGMLAHELRPCLTHAGCTVVGRGRPDVDITQATSIRRTLADVQPDVLANAAAYAAVDKAESEPDAVFAVNRDGPGHVAAACRDVGVPLIYVSTDYVFDGSGSRPYGEEDRIAPLGRYGQNKWAGEEAVHSCHRQHVIVRTAWLYERHGQNFVETMLRLAREREVPGGGRPAPLPDLEPGPGQGPGDGVSTHHARREPRALGHLSLLRCRTDHLVRVRPGHL